MKCGSLYWLLRCLHVLARPFVPHPGAPLKPERCAIEYIRETILLHVGLLFYRRCMACINSSMRHSPDCRCHIIFWFPKEDKHETSSLRFCTNTPIERQNILVAISEVWSQVLDILQAILNNFIADILNSMWRHRRRDSRARCTDVQAKGPRPFRRWRHGSFYLLDSNCWETLMASSFFLGEKSSFIEFNVSWSSRVKRVRFSISLVFLLHQTFSLSINN